jgi:periplasmic protein TonB
MELFAMAPLLLPVILGGKVNWRFSACRQSHRMRMRFSYAVSAVTHALLLGALALANDWLRPEFAVRSGQAAPNAQPSAQPRTVAQPLDTRIEPDLRATIEIDAPPFPDWTEPVPPPPTAADLDERLVLRPPIEETLRRRSERSMEVVLLPTADPVPLDRPETAPELDGRPLLPLWTPVPEEMIPLPDRQQPERPLVAARPVATTEVADPGEAETPVESSITPPGASVERLPLPLPSNQEPVYPDEYRRRQIGGRVLLWLAIGPDGRVEDVRIEQSSGHLPLDQSALAAVRNWRFAPAQRGGEPVRFEVRLPVTFSIRSR